MDSPQHEFQPLTRLLHLKRFEVPPPGFHKRFRARVMTRIEMEREWSGQPWFQRALAALTWQRGLAVANGVALAGVAFLGVATFHVAHTVVNEEEEVQIFAALPLPGIPSARDGSGQIMGDGMLIAEASTGRFTARMSAANATGHDPAPAFSLAHDAFQKPATSTYRDDSSAPSWLFDPPTNQERKPAPPRFILPGSSRTSPSTRSR